MFGFSFGGGMRVLGPPPDCECCGAKPGDDHAKDCNLLRAMRVQAYPEVLSDDGMPWWWGAMKRLDRRIAELEAEIARLKSDR